VDTYDFFPVFVFLLKNRHKRLLSVLKNSRGLESMLLILLNKFNYEMLSLLLIWKFNLAAHIYH
jgi:hypothetical protein